MRSRDSSAIDDEPCHWSFAFGQRVDSRAVRLACSRAPMGRWPSFPSSRSALSRKLAPQCRRRCCAAKFETAWSFPTGSSAWPASVRDSALSMGAPTS